ncbi:MAG: FMN-binding negative transcriptional regulator [Rhizobiaceae bacterium]
MYEPPHHKESRQDVLHDFIVKHPLGLLISSGPEGPYADLVPFLLDRDFGAHGRLRAHIARANPQVKRLAEAQRVLVVFQGADSYVTPSWYETKRETGKVVPTWNYVVVQAGGMVRLIDDRGWLAGQVAELTNVHESGRERPWQVSDAPDAFIEAQLKGIVGMEIELTDIAGKWKVSQNRPVPDRVGVAEGLDAEPAGTEMAGIVRRYGGLEPA